MLIGEICKKTELSKDTIRFYEKRGLLQVERTSSEHNNYKNYTNEHLQRLQLIKKAKRFGFTLNEIVELLELYDTNSANCSVLQEKVQLKIADIDRRILDLQEIKGLILGGVQKAGSECLSRVEAKNCELLVS